VRQIMDGRSSNMCNLTANERRIGESLYIDSDGKCAGSRQGAPEHGATMARILIADDDRAIRSTVSLLLNAKGHDVVETANGREGLVRSASGSTEWPDYLASFLASFLANFLTMATKPGAVQSLRKPFRAQELLTAAADCLNIPPVGGHFEPYHGQSDLQSSV
jgi:hypothetical protein